MTIQPIETTGQAVVVVAAEHQARQNAIRAAQIAAIIAAYRQVDPERPVLSWINDGIGDQIFVLVSVAQELMASESEGYIARALAAQGITADVPILDPQRFAAVASDNRPLDSLLAGAPIRTGAKVRHGETPAAAMRSGEAWLRMVADTQIADAGRAADSAVIAGLQDAKIDNSPTLAARTANDVREQQAARRASPPRSRADLRERLRQANSTTTLSPSRQADVERRLREKYGAGGPGAPTGTVPAPREPNGKGVSVGYIRMLTPPSCDRCAVLAGRWYRWNKGFERHPMCDCRHIPAAEAAADDLTTDPQAYFDSLSEAQQDTYFGKANAQAIRDGADIYQVVNAQREGAMFTADDGRRYTREGTTRRGVAGAKARKRGKPQVLRPTVWQIYKDSRGDRNAARQMLVSFGYILS